MLCRWSLIWSRPLPRLALSRFTAARCARRAAWRGAPRLLAHEHARRGAQPRAGLPPEVARAAAAAAAAVAAAAAAALPALVRRTVAAVTQPLPGLRPSTLVSGMSVSMNRCRSA